MCTCQSRVTLMPDEVNDCDAEIAEVMIPEDDIHILSASESDPDL